MSKECFDKLCEKIMNAVGEKNFLSEEYMFYSGTIDSNIHRAAKAKSDAEAAAEEQYQMAFPQMVPQ